ncbi:unnamed protein product [Calypogeia fissa]
MVVPGGVTRLTRSGLSIIEWTFSGGLPPMSFFWIALLVTMPEPPPAVNMAMLEATRKVRKLALPVAALVSVTAVSGAFVAGNDAGHAYNSFPNMGDTWIPEGILEMKPMIKNFFENTAIVQFDHHIFAVTTLSSIGGMWLATRKLPLHPAVKSLLDSTLNMAGLQVTLGISALLLYVPISLGSAHQAGAFDSIYNSPNTSAHVKEAITCSL